MRAKKTRVSVKLNKKQREFFNVESKYTVLAAGRRFGKGEFAARWQLIKHALIKRSEEDNPHAWVAPTFRQTKLGYYKQIKFLKNNNIDFKPNKSDLYIDLYASGHGEKYNFFSRVQFFSLDRPDLIEGFAFKSLVMDESGISLKNPETWENSLSPTTLDFDCPVLFIGTPKGKNLYYKFFLNGEDETQKDWVSLTATSYDNTIENGGVLKKEVIDRLISQLPENVVQQEIYANFVDLGGIVFRKIKQCATGKFRPQTNKKRFIAGLDLAKVNDYTVLTVGTTEGDVYHIERFNKIDWNLQKDLIYTICKRYNAKILVDSTGVGDPILEDLKRMGLSIEGYYFTHNSKSELINKLVVAIENESITFPPYKQLLLELEAYEYQVTLAGNIKTNAPIGFHDDCVISLALFNYLVIGKNRGGPMNNNLIIGTRESSRSDW